MLPTFLGIGVNKAGTTWLHYFLRSHPRIWMPLRRKEVHFFTRHYEKGTEWYERFFPDSTEADHYDAVGEYTPAYFYDEACPGRIAEVSSIQKFILSLRNPVDRLYSAYGHEVRNHNYRGSFEEFLQSNPHQINRGFYASHLKNYFRHFDRQQFLILRFEELFSDVDTTKRKIARFLDVDAEGFDEDEVAENATFVPRFQRAFAVAQSVLRVMKKWEMGGVLVWMKRTGIGPWLKGLFGKREKESALPSMSPAVRARLAREYLPQIEALESLTHVDFSVWKRNLPLY